jgi:N-acetylmuramoyl-L-alanine amidase
VDFLKKRVFIIGLFVFLVSLPLFSQDTDLISFLNTHDAELLWNHFTETGIIIKDDTEIVFKLGESWILCDYTYTYKAEGIKRDKGKIIFPETVMNRIHDYFQKKEKIKKAPRVSIILIDPGHGGKDPGAYATHTIGKGKAAEKITLYEKDLTLDVSLLLYGLLKDRYKDKKIILTRSTDEYLKLEERVEIANSIETGPYEAIVYISIHFNASFNKKAKGFEVWYLPQDYRRNLIDEREIPDEDKDIIPILNTMLEEEYTLESITLAKAISAGLQEKVGDVTNERGLKEESWFVVRNAKMPSVLLELGFISNKEEAGELRKETYLNNLAKGVYNGICTFVEEFESTKGFTE